MSEKVCEADRMTAGNLGCGKSQALGCQFQNLFCTQFINLALEAGEAGGLLHSGNQLCGKRLTPGPENSHNPNNSLRCLFLLTWTCFVGPVAASHIGNFLKPTLKK